MPPQPIIPSLIMHLSPLCECDATTASWGVEAKLHQHALVAEILAAYGLADGAAAKFLDL